jgi:hypothetical protein
MIGGDTHCATPGLSAGAEDGLKPSSESLGLVMAMRRDWAVCGTAGTAGSAPDGGGKVALATGALTLEELALGGLATGTGGGDAEATVLGATAALPAALGGGEAVGGAVEGAEPALGGASPAVGGTSLAEGGASLAVGGGAPALASACLVALASPVVGGGAAASVPARKASALY